MGTLTTEVPASATGSKRSGTDNLENEAIGLDVGVRIHGSQVAAVVLESTEHVEPFEEDTSTMIVFPRGAVVKLRARVRTGHAVVLTHLGTKQTALCRIIQVNSAANVAHYVKLEFIQPAPGFWGVHFPSDNSASVTKPVEHAAIGRDIEKIGPPVAPVKNTAPMTEAAPPHVEAPVTPPKPIVREAAKEVLKPATVPAPALSYGISDGVRADELVPLAAAPPKRAPSAPKPQPIAPPPAIQTARSAANLAVEAPIFDSLSTGEEVFGKESTAVSAEEALILKSDQKAAQAFVRSLDPASLLQSGVVPNRHTGLKVFLSLAAVVIVAAGAVFYVRQYRGNARQEVSAATPVSISQAPAAAATSAAPAQAIVETPPLSVPQTQPQAQTRSVAKHEPVETSAESTITVTPVHNNSRSAALESHATISNGMANIYAGDLAARPETTQHATVAISAPMPTINGTPKDVVATPSNAGIGSLMAGSSNALPAPPKPAEPKPLVRGGQLVEPRLIARFNPSYPPMAVSNRVEGDVEIEAMIDQTGKVTSTKVVSGPTLLRGAATNAVRQWKYSPATLDGKPIAMQYKVTVRFRLGQ